MRNSLLFALLLASAFQTALGEQSGEWTYSVENNQATITYYTGAGGAVTIPSEVNGIPVVRVGVDWAPVINNSVTSVTIPNSVTSIGSTAFMHCTGLTSITIGNSVTNIGEGAFYCCSSLTSINIPNSVTSIGMAAFYDCTSLTSATIGNGVTIIGMLMFNGCSNLTRISIPNSVTSIGWWAFSGCTSLTSATIGNGVTNIGDRAFDNCSGLTSLIIPNGVTSIGDLAFRGCTSLTSVVIPNSVTSIGKDAFKYCTTLSSVYLPVRFETTYTNFGLTDSQVSFYDTTSPSYLMGQQSVINNPSAHNLYTATQYTANFNAGKDSILNSPNSNGLYTANQMQAMAIRDLVLIKNANGSFTLNYDIEKSEDLQSWTTHAPLSLTLTNLPPDKAFVRIKAKQ